LALVGGCGGGSSSGGGTLDCAWLAGDNCWKTTLADAADCLPPDTETGVLSADGKTCTFTNGITIAFATPLAVPPPDQATFNFTVTNGGVECLHFENPQRSTKLVVKGKTVQEGLAGATGLAVSCPDGTSFSNPNAFSLFMCGDDGGAGLGSIPGEGWSSGGTDVSFELLGAAGGSQHIFTCGR
jgi:hypothetical protein